MYRVTSIRDALVREFYANSGGLFCSNFIKSPTFALFRDSIAKRAKEGETCLLKIQMKCHFHKFHNLDDAWKPAPFDCIIVCSYHQFRGEFLNSESNKIKW